MLPSLTVIICTYNRAFIIGECLESLVRQTTALETFEILLVDNNSNDETQKVAASYVHKLPNLKIAEELQQGLSHARNRGVAEAQTEWIAFLDDDAKARPDWVETILATIAKDDFDAFGGPYYAWHRSGPPPSWFPENFGTYFGAPQYGQLGQFHIPGGNCALKKTAAQAAGSFSTELGMSGNKSAYGEETLLFNRMKEHGYRLGFVPDMAIDHCVLPYKYSLRWQFASAFAAGRDCPCAFAEQFSWRNLLGACHFCGKSVWNFLFCCCKICSPNWKRSMFIAARQTMNSLGGLYTMLNMAIKRSPCPRP